MTSWDPMMVLQAQVLMSNRVLHEKNEVLEERIKTVIEAVVELYKNDIKEAKRISGL